MECQSWVDECSQNVYDSDDDKLSIHETSRHCELVLCYQGPMHCGIGGQCARRICQDLTPGPVHAPKCKDCVKPWIECIHDLCLLPTHDGYADRSPSLNCYKQDKVQCEHYGWQDFNTAPNPFCVARCWANTPSHCQAGGQCAHPEFSKTGIGFKSHPLTSSEHSLATLSRGCNTFRDECVQTCDLAKVHNKCTEKCNKRYRKSGGAKRQLCKDECEERTCFDECRDKTCCLGPEQCRVGGEAFRCSGVTGLDCRRLVRVLDDIS
jgi:hypothetical protein